MATMENDKGRIPHARGSQPACKPEARGAFATKRRPEVAERIPPGDRNSAIINENAEYDGRQENEPGFCRRAGSFLLEKLVRQCQPSSEGQARSKGVVEGPARR